MKICVYARVIGFMGGDEAMIPMDFIEAENFRKAVCEYCESDEELSATFISDSSASLFKHGYCVGKMRVVE